MLATLRLATPVWEDEDVLEGVETVACLRIGGVDTLRLVAAAGGCMKTSDMLSGEPFELMLRSISAERISTGRCGGVTYDVGG